MKKALIIHVTSCLILTAGLVWGIVEGVDFIVNRNQVSFLFLIPTLAGLGSATLHILTSPVSKFRKF